MDASVNLFRFSWNMTPRESLDASVNWPGVPTNAIAINDIGVHTKMSLNVSHRVVSPAGIAGRTASLEIRLKL